MEILCDCHGNQDKSKHYARQMDESSHVRNANDGDSEENDERNKKKIYAEKWHRYQKLV